MKHFFTLLFLLLAFNILNAQETYRFRTDAPQGLNIESSTAIGLSLHYSVNEITVANVEYDKVIGQEIVMQGSFGSFAEGLPNLPFENRYIAVPRGATVSVKVKENGCQVLHDIALLPAAPLQMNGEDKRPALRWESKVFDKDANFPTNNVCIAQTTQIRGLDVVMLNVTPFRYNPVRKTLEVVYDMDIEVHFEDGDGQFGDPRYRNPAWDGILRDLVINSNMLPETHYYEHLNEAIQNHEEGCEYLIISPDDPAILAWADTLKQFRTRQGILTKVVTTTDCGGNEAEDIRNFILNAYENWAIPPAAVLLFAENHSGAPEFGLKPYVFTSPPSYGHTYLYPSDNPFADMNGDSIPDLAISRMVTKYPSEYKQQVEKLIDYELNPPTEPHYYDHPVISSGYQEDKWFMITSQCVNSFFCNKLGKHTSNNYVVFDQINPNPTPPDSIWSTGPNTNAVLDYFGPDGTDYIPMTIGGLDEWNDMADIQPLVDAMSDGGFLTFYRDHSSEDLWCCPWFEGSHIQLLHNEEPTFIFSIGCLTNDFWDNWTTCLSESFLKAKPGAIGVLGANSVTFSHFNDLITWGMVDYFWPDYMPTLGSQTEPDFPYPSYSLVAGKLFLRQQAFLPYISDTVQIEKTLNVFSFLGETYLQLYTEVPQPLTIEASPYHTNDQREYSFTAEEGATVCLSRNNEIIAVARATGEKQSIALPQMEVGEQFIITITKHNRIRHEQTVTIITSDLPFVYLKANTINDQDGNGQLEYGEYADIDITIRNASPIESEGGTITLLCESPYIEILKSTTHYPQMESDSTITIETAFRIKLADDVPDQTDIRFTAHFDEGKSVHDDYFDIIANAPLIVINKEFRPMTDEGEPSTHIDTEGKSAISFTLNNIGHSTATHLDAVLDIKAPFINVEHPDYIETLLPNESKTVTHVVNVTPNDISGAWLQSRLDVQYGERHASLDTIVQYGGFYESFETDTLNRAFNWSPGPNQMWSFYEDAYEGQRCLRFAFEDHYGYNFTATPKGSYLVTHASKTSFRYKNSHSNYLYVNNSGNITKLAASDSWTYMEALAPVRHQRVTWGLASPEPIGDTLVAMIDDICFPPRHTTIAYAGDELLSCSESPVELSKAYAYDCDSILWTTNGDGHFDYDTIANPFYFPGDQDIANGSATLTLTAFGNDTIVSSTLIRFVDEINLGAIVGDSVVNKYQDQISHYSVESQDGINYRWQLAPAMAGSIYDHGNVIDILWNLNEADAEVSLSVKAENGCDMEPVTKNISLIGTGTTEWHTLDFSLFPNPTDGKINLVLSESLQGKATIEVFNLLGERMLVKQAYLLRQGDTISIDLSKMVSGLYIIRLSTENGSCSKKVSVW